jgi:hypothetical protein
LAARKLKRKQRKQKAKFISVQAVGRDFLMFLIASELEKRGTNELMAAKKRCKPPVTTCLHP